MEWIEQDRGDPFARWVGAALIAEALLLAASRFFTLVYIVALQVNRPDEEHLPRTVYVPFLLTAIGFVSILGWAGTQLRRTPAGAWHAATLVGRIDLFVAGGLNVALAAQAAVGLFSGDPRDVEPLVAWLLTAVVALTIVVGLVRDAAGRARPTVER